MPKVHSHYENLRVARNAPPEVIKAAYRVLAQKHHPDRDPSGADALDIMSMLNEAYRVLSDATLRAEHDAWIHRAEHTANPEELQRSNQADPFEPRPMAPDSKGARNSGSSETGHGVGAELDIDLDVAYASFKRHLPGLVWLTVVLVALLVLTVLLAPRGR